VHEDDALRQLLVVERVAAAERVAVLAGDLDALIQSAVGTNADDEHDPEGATLAFERAQLSALLTAAQQRLTDLDDAIARLAAGTYGTCQTCGQPIPAARLVARPAASTCLACAANAAR
jgi:RNA polymerase-binding transcription factor